MREVTRICDVLLDIEGTTTPVDFVYGTLFPFARAHVEEFLSQHYRNDEVAAEVEALKRQREADAEVLADFPPWREDSLTARIASASAYVRWLMDHDRKVTAMKSIQGRIWEAGYRSREIRGQVYPDVAPAFERWRRQGRKIVIFSSGSVLAQRLLFAHSTAGDLTPQISAFFDTTIGPKQEAESYRRIAAALALSPSDVLFVSDVVAELNAACSAGMPTRLCVRGGAAAAGSQLTHQSHPSIHRFNEVFP